jgi:hypothetical protein
MDKYVGSAVCGTTNSRACTPILIGLPDEVVRRDEDGSEVSSFGVPTVQAASIDLLWFGILGGLVAEMSWIILLVIFKLFVPQGMTGRELTWLARAALPFFGLMVLAVLLIYLFPQAVLWLPSLM